MWVIDRLKDLYESVKADAENNNGQGYPEGVTIRILLGAYEQVFSNSRTFEDQRVVVLEDLLASQIPIEEGGYWKIEVAVHRNVEVWVGGGNTGDIYSHVKMMVVDGEKTIVAGYNTLSNGWLSGFVGTYDAGIGLSGGGIGQAALNVFDDLWSEATLCKEVVVLPQGIHTCRENEMDSATAHPAEVLSIGPYTGNEVNVFSLYRDEVDKTADEATEEALSASTNKINVFQNRFLYDPNKEVPVYVTGIVNALQNNSQVRILTACNLFECILNARSLANIRDYIAENVSPNILNNFEYRPFMPAFPDLRLRSQPIPGVHAKTVSIDGQFLIIGSHNFDYSAFGNTPEDEDLAEYSIGVDDETATDVFDAYFEERWDTQSFEVAQVEGSIQNAVAQAEPGAVVVVPEGTYSETVTIDKPLIILGLSGDRTIVEPPQGGQPAFQVTSSDVTIYNLTVKNSEGYGIKLQNTSPGGLEDAFIRKVLFKDNALGGVFVESLTPGNPINYVMENNTIVGGQYGIRINVSEEQTITSTLRNNLLFGQSATPIKIDSATDGGVKYGYNLFNTCTQVSEGACPADWYEGSLSLASSEHDNLLNVDPRFIDPTTGDYRLLSDSPAIDAGDPTTISERRPDGNITLRADIGAFEMVDLPSGPFQEVGGLVAMEAEHFAQHLQFGDRAWVTQNNITGYAGSGYLSALPDTALLFTNAYTATSPELQYTINFTTTGVYTVWVRGYAPNAAGDSLYVKMDDQPVITLTGLIPQTWSWARKATDGGLATIEITQPGVYTLHLWQREDGLRLDRIILTTDNNYTPTGNGPPESGRTSSPTP